MEAREKGGAEGDGQRGQRGEIAQSENRTRREDAQISPLPLPFRLSRMTCERNIEMERRERRKEGSKGRKRVRER